MVISRIRLGPEGRQHSCAGDLELLRSERFGAEPFSIVWPEVGVWEGNLIQLFRKYVGLFGRRKGKRKR